GTAFSMLVYSAALNEIPKEITEAAEVDGAGGFVARRVRRGGQRSRKENRSSHRSVISALE
ncbi:hypothetical protein ACWGA0_32730, partial [Streptomyces erythrochromogenes]